MSDERPPGLAKIIRENLDPAELIQSLFVLMNDKASGPAVQLGAAQRLIDLLDRGWGRPPQFTSLDDA